MTIAPRIVGPVTDSASARRTYWRWNATLKMLLLPPEYGSRGLDGSTVDSKLGPYNVRGYRRCQEGDEGGNFSRFSNPA